MSNTLKQVIDHYEAIPHLLDSFNYGQEESASFFGTTATMRGNHSLGYVEDSLRTPPFAPVNDFPDLFAYHRQQAGYSTSGEQTQAEPDYSTVVGIEQPQAENAAWSDYVPKWNWLTPDVSGQIAGNMSSILLFPAVVLIGLTLLVIGLVFIMPSTARETIIEGAATAVPGGGAIRPIAKKLGGKKK